MTDQDAGDASQVEPLLDQINMPIGQFTADGAYDGEPTYDAVTRHSADATVIIPPRANAVERQQDNASRQRNRHIGAIDADGRMKWQATTSYGKRSLVETAMGRYKSIIGRRLRARSFAAQQTEVGIGCSVLNRMWPAHARNPFAAIRFPHSAGIKDGNPFPLRSLHQRPSGVIRSIRLPRRRRPVSYSGQFVTLSLILPIRWRREALCLKGIVVETSYRAGPASTTPRLTIPAPKSYESYFGRRLLMI